MKLSSSYTAKSLLRSVILPSFKSHGHLIIFLVITLVSSFTTSHKGLSRDAFTSFFNKYIHEDSSLTDGNALLRSVEKNSKTSEFGVMVFSHLQGGYLVLKNSKEGKFPEGFGPNFHAPFTKISNQIGVRQKQLTPTPVSSLRSNSDMELASIESFQTP